MPILFFFQCNNDNSDNILIMKKIIKYE